MSHSLRLRITGVTILALLVLPALGLARWPRPRAAGLERLLSRVSLLQSFPATPSRPVPALWQQRLGPERAERLWRRQRQLWWQFWGGDGDGGAFLALPLPGTVYRPADWPALALPVDDLVVVAPDPLSRRQLADQLRLVARQRRGLQRRCLERLQQGQAVFWSPQGLAGLTGPLAPLLQRAQEGCLTLELRSPQLRFEGEAGSSEGLLAGPPQEPPPSAAAPLPPDVLLQLQGPAPQLLLQGLLARQLIREPLAARYGLGPAQLPLLQRTPFRLRLRALPEGPFQASLELQLAVRDDDRRAWAQVLARLREALLQQGLEEGPAQLTGGQQPGRQLPGEDPASAPSRSLLPAPPRSAILPAASFRRDDGLLQGGWRWLSRSGTAPQLLLYLAAPPSAPDPLGDPAPVFSLQARPALLGRLALMPPGLPQPVQQADQLSLQLWPLDQPLSRLRGALRLGPRPAAPPPR